MLSADYQNKAKELDDLRKEAIKVIRGESRLDADLLGSLVVEADAGAQEAMSALAQAKAELDACVETSENVKREYDKILNWADLYDGSTLEAKKMIVSQFIKAVRVKRNYEIEIDFNVSFEDFQNFSTSERELEESKTSKELRTSA